MNLSENDEINSSRALRPRPPPPEKWFRVTRNFISWISPNARFYSYDRVRVDMVTEDSTKKEETFQFRRVDQVPLLEMVFNSTERIL